MLRLHPGPSRRSRTTQAPSALSQGEYACGGTPLAICAAAMASRRCHTVLPHPAAEFSWFACFASQSPLHGCAMLSPLCTRGASLCPSKHNRPRQRRNASAVIFSLPGSTQPAKAKAECLRWHTLFARANTTCQGKDSMAVAARHPAWGAKKVGEKLSFSPRASGGVT